MREFRGARIWAREMIRSARADAVIFDMDGVLADTERFHLESWQVVLERRFARKVPADVIRKTFGQSNEKIFPLLLPPEAVPAGAELGRLSREKEAAYRESARGRVRPLPGAERFLAWLAGRGIPAAVGTSGPVENVRFILEEFRWAGLFRAVVDRSRFAASKPAPDCFLAAAEILGVRAGRAIVFEDSLHGIAAARRAGAWPAAVATTFPEAVLLPRARWTVRDFRDIACD